MPAPMHIHTQLLPDDLFFSDRSNRRQQVGVNSVGVDAMAMLRCALAVGDGSC